MDPEQAELVTVRRVGDEVMVTMSPQRAEFVAEFLVADDPGISDWLDELAYGLCAAAGPGGSSATLGPPGTGVGSRPSHDVDAENPLDDDFFVRAKAVMLVSDTTKADIAAAVESVAARATLNRQKALRLAAKATQRAAGEAQAVRDAEVGSAVTAMLVTVRQAAALQQRSVEKDAEAVAEAAAAAVRLANQWDLEQMPQAERAARIAGIVDTAASAMAEQSKTRAADMALFAADAAVAAAEAAVDAQARIDLVVATAAIAVGEVAVDAEHLVAIETIEAAAVVKESAELS